MKRIICFVLIIVTVLTGCNHPGNNQKTTASQMTQVKFVMSGEPIEMPRPPLVQNESVYITLDSLASLPGIKAEYNQATGEITATRIDATLVMHLGQPLKTGNKNGAKPFLKQGTVYVPLADTLESLYYNVQTQKDSDGTLVVTLEKTGFDSSDMAAKSEFTAEELQAAETALAQGVTIADPQNDFYQIPASSVGADGRSANTKPYPLAFTDIKSVTFGADSQYFYLRIDLYGAFPDKLPYYENSDLGKTDFITGVGGGLFLNYFHNRNTGKDDVGSFQISISYVRTDDKEYTDQPDFLTPPLISLLNSATITNNKYPNGDTIYKITDNNGRADGGAGKDYLLGAFPFQEFGLQPGDVIEGSFGIETNSKIFDHERIDTVLDCGWKVGEVIRYQLGANTYENLGPPNK